MAVCSEPGSADLTITRVRKLRRLPLPGEVMVQLGERVDPEHPVARISLKPGIPWVVPVARLIGVEPAALETAMLRKVGDRVKVKEIIARAERGIYGRKELEAPTDGIIEEISTKSGRVTIREEFGREEPSIQVDVAFELGVKPRDVRTCMLRQIGDEVKKGQIFAKKGEMSAFFTKTSIAPISGIIESINDQTGRVVIARPFKEVIVKAYLDGTVDEVVPGRGAWISAPAVRLTGIFGLGREAYGELRLLCDRPDEQLTADKITPDCAGKIIIGGGYATNEALTRALAVGVKGVIAGTASYLHIVSSLGVKLGVGITGQEDVGLTVILMEGFGHLSMREEAFATLRLLAGRYASINGATQIRAGAIRPEIIVAFPEHQGELAQPRVIDEELSLGLRVRIINDPWFGQMGKVVAIPREPRTIETGARVPVVEVELESGQTVTVPRPNVEVW